MALVQEFAERRWNFRNMPPREGRGTHAAVTTQGKNRKAFSMGARISEPSVVSRIYPSASVSIDATPPRASTKSLARGDGMSSRTASPSTKGEENLWVLGEGAREIADTHRETFVVAPSLAAQESWQPDKEASECPCGTRFGLVRRRHHCRVCGLVRCGKCSRNVGIHVAVATAEEPFDGAGSGAEPPQRDETLSVAPTTSILGTLTHASFDPTASASSASSGAARADRFASVADLSPSPRRLTITRTAFLRVCVECEDHFAGEWTVVGRLHGLASEDLRARVAASSSPSGSPSSPVLSACPAGSTGRMLSSSSIGPSKGSSGGSPSFVPVTLAKVPSGNSSRAYSPPPPAPLETAEEDTTGCLVLRSGRDSRGRRRRAQGPRPQAVPEQLGTMTAGGFPSHSPVPAGDERARTPPVLPLAACAPAGRGRRPGAPVLRLRRRSGNSMARDHDGSAEAPKEARTLTQKSTSARQLLQRGSTQPPALDMALVGPATDRAAIGSCSPFALPTSTGGGSVGPRSTNVAVGDAAFAFAAEASDSAASEAFAAADGIAARSPSSRGRTQVATPRAAFPPPMAPTRADVAPPFHRQRSAPNRPDKHAAAANARGHRRAVSNAASSRLTAEERVASARARRGQPPPRPAQAPADADAVCRRTSADSASARRRIAHEDLTIATDTGPLRVRVCSVDSNLSSANGAPAPAGAASLSGASASARDGPSQAIPVRRSPALSPARGQPSPAGRRSPAVRPGHRAGPSTNAAQMAAAVRAAARASAATSSRGALPFHSRPAPDATSPSAAAGHLDGLSFGPRSFGSRRHGSVPANLSALSGSESPTSGTPGSPATPGLVLEPEPAIARFLQIHQCRHCGSRIAIEDFEREHSAAQGYCSQDCLTMHTLTAGF